MCCAARNAVILGVCNKVLNVAIFDEKRGGRRKAFCDALQQMSQGVTKSAGRSGACKCLLWLAFSVKRRKASQSVAKSGTKRRKASQGVCNTPVCDGAVTDVICDG